MAVLCTACWGFPAAQAESKEKLLTATEFTQRFAEILREKLPDHMVSVVGEFEIDITGGTAEGSAEPYEIGSANAYALYCATPTELESMLVSYAEAIDEMVNGSGGDEELSLDDLMPVLRSSSYLESMPAEKREDVAFLEWLDGIDILLVWNSSKTVRVVTQSELKERGLGLDDALEIAKTNLARIAPNVQWLRTEGGLMGPVLDGMYESSLLLLPLWERTGFGLGGDTIVAVPSRGTVMVIDSENTDLIASVNQYLIDGFDSLAYPVYDKLLRWNGMEFVPYADSY